LEKGKKIVVLVFVGKEMEFVVVAVFVEIKRESQMIAETTMFVGLVQTMKVSVCENEE